MDEFQSKVKPTAKLKIAKYHEKKEKELLPESRMPDMDVIVTTYGMIERDDGVLITENSKYVTALKTLKNC